ncbi:hypothetical protein ACVIJ6_003209 [Bradyrhizobium sp. USDA 4369]
MSSLRLADRGRERQILLQSKSSYLLSSEMRLAPSYHKKLRGIAFWINPPGRTDGIRVIVTLQALAGLSGKRDYADLEDAWDAFAAAHDLIESAARIKYERIKDRIGLFEGTPTFLLMTGDRI